MKVDRIVGVAIVRREIHATAEPPHRRRGARCTRDEKPHVHVHGRRVRVARMQNERHAECVPGATGELGARCRRRRRQSLARDVREIDAAALEYAALLDYAADTATTFGSLPGIGAKWLAVDRRERIGDALLQASQILPD